MKSISKKEALTILDALKKKLMKDINSKLAEETGEGKGMGDLYDLASSERERELSLLLSDRDRQKLASIEEAYERIEEGSYGHCESCGEAIAAGRMRAVPFAIMCVECQSQSEKEEAMMRDRTYLDDRTYQGLADADFDENEN